MLKSAFDNVKANIGIFPFAQATATESLGTAIDTLGLQSLLAEFKNGVATGTPDSYSIACAVKECATSGGSYTTISGATATITADSTHVQVRVDGLGTGSRLRYIKLSMTPTIVNGSTPKCLIAADALTLSGISDPVTNSATAKATN